MIFIAHRGAGKTTLAKKNKRFIDLDTAEFFVPTGGSREDWYKAYCRFAVGLSKQGYGVFVSNCPEVVYFLVKHSVEVCIIMPSDEVVEKMIKEDGCEYDVVKPVEDIRATVKKMANSVGRHYVIMNCNNWTEMLELEKVLEGFLGE